MRQCNNPESAIHDWSESRHLESIFKEKQIFLVCHFRVIALMCTILTSAYYVRIVLMIATQTIIIIKHKMCATDVNVHLTSTYICSVLGLLSHSQVVTLSPALRPCMSHRVRVSMMCLPPNPPPPSLCPPLTTWPPASPLRVPDMTKQTGRRGPSIAGTQTHRRSRELSKFYRILWIVAKVFFLFGKLKSASKTL